MRHYLVTWQLPGRGQYIPPDPCCGGNYYKDKYVSQIMYARSLEQIRKLVKDAYPDAQNIRIRRLQDG